MTLPAPFPWQRQVTAGARRFNVLCLGRRAGKTHYGVDRIAAPDVLAYPNAWFTPSYRYMAEVWRDVGNRLSPIITRQNAAERRMDFVTGGSLEFWTMIDTRAGMGRKYRRVIIDEAAFVPYLMDIWLHAIRPTLADYRGDAYIPSTPKGRNAFWQMYQWGLDPEQSEWACWQMPSEVNPLLSREELVAMRAQLPERVAAQELDAQFLDDAGGVFRHVLAAATAEPQDGAIGGHTYTIGVDWARESDFTAIAVYDVTMGAIVALDRFNQIDYQIQLGRLTALCERFHPAAVIAEANSIGQPLIEQLQRAGLPVVPFTTTNASKQIMVDALALALENGAITFIPDPVLIAELQAYQGERLAGGLMRYSAPGGMHDDTVMAVMLAYQNPRPAVAEVTRYAQSSFSTTQRSRR